MGRDKVLNPSKSGFSHELPDNDNGVQGKSSLPGVVFDLTKKGVFQLIGCLGRVRVLVSSDE